MSREAWRGRIWAVGFGGALLAAVGCDAPDLRTAFDADADEDAQAGDTAGDSAPGGWSDLPEEAPNEPDGPVGSEPPPPPEPEPDLGLDFDCLKIDKIGGVNVVPPAGLQVGFRIMDCNGDPIGPITDDMIRVINDEKGEPFGTGLEGGAVSRVAIPESYGLATVLVLDFSDSIINSGAVDQMIDGARTFLSTIEVTPSKHVEHQVAIIAFGRPDAYFVAQEFTNNHGKLRSQLEELRSSPPLGGTDLYGTYEKVLEHVQTGGQQFELVERFVVLMTDGTHEAGAEVAMRQAALNAKKTYADTHVYTIGLDGFYDPGVLAELASTEESFFHVSNESALEEAFEGAGRRIDGIARANVEVGICTPVALGQNASLTVEVMVDQGDQRRGQTSFTRTYPVKDLTGDLAACNADDIANGNLCGNGQIDFGEDCEPGLDLALGGIACDDSCHYDFSQVPQLYCHEMCSWTDQFDCTQAEADIFCRLKTGEPNAVATSWNTTIALDAPGFACPFGVAGTQSLGSFPRLGEPDTVYYEPASMLTSHGPGNVIVDVVCN